ncbi:glutathione synthetase, chloroplastic [Arachis duranensis]|uniref:Glutathione synthetase n=1 Tax=Arachis duranensis TaxID=130453 RepID=A0A9C6TR11_ARADU|nr:glutathione synthetase, chloroplastic [Arachis duranensis]
MGVSLCFTTSATYTLPSFSSSYNRSPSLSQTLFFPFCPKPLFSLNLMSKSKCGNVDDHTLTSSLFDYHRFDHQLLQSIAYDSLVWASLHGLLVGHKSIQNSGTVPGVGLVHAPFALLPNPFPEIHWKQACHLAPLFNELVDRVSLDGKFLQESLSRTKKVDEFTSRLLDIHSKMLEINKKEDIRLGLHRSDYMLDEQTNSLLQIELNTISSSFAGLSSLVSKLHRNTLSHYGKLLGLDSERVPANNSVNLFVEALAKAWSEYNNPRAVIMFIVQAVERNMYDQHFLSVYLRERHHITTIRKTLAEVDQEGELLPDGTLAVGGQAIAVIYFRAGYTPADFPSESFSLVDLSFLSVWIKSISRFLENKDDIAKLRECFAGLWSLDDSDIARKAIERPELYVMKPQREGGGNNIYGDAVRETLQKLQKAGSQEDAAYILMQRIFPTTSAAILMRDGCWHKDHAISELGIYGTYLRNKDKVIMNNQSGYLMRTKVSSSDEGGVAAGFAVLDSVYLT